MDQADTSDAELPEKSPKQWRGGQRLIHYSKYPLSGICSARQDGGKSHNGNKPNGLWISVEGDDDWRQWCESESFALDCLASATEIILSKDAKIEAIISKDDLKAFHRHYGRPRYYRSDSHYEVIDWDAVARMCDGIIIAPYQWECRLDAKFHWYYGWDCASGCIWNSSAISRIVQIYHSQGDRTDASKSDAGSLKPNQGNDLDGAQIYMRRLWQRVHWRLV